MPRKRSFDFFDGILVGIALTFAISGIVLASKQARTLRELEIAFQRSPSIEGNRGEKQGI